MAALRIKGLIYVIGLISGALISICFMSIHPISLSVVQVSRDSREVGDIAAQGRRKTENVNGPVGEEEDDVENDENSDKNVANEEGDETNHELHFHDHNHGSDDERERARLDKRGGAGENAKEGETGKEGETAKEESGGKDGDKLVAVEFHDESHHQHDQSQVAEALYKSVRVLCWVMTSPENHKTKAVHILATWGKRCNKILFVSEQEDKDLPIVKVDVKYGREHLTAKTMAAFDHIYSHHRDDAEWFLKADDDTYVIVENLRYFLSEQNHNESIYFGHHFKMYVNQGYFSGGGGYVLSREALRRFGQRPNTTCSKDDGAEDVEIGRCMESLGVVAGDSRDNLGRSRFHCFNPETHVHGIYPDWYFTYDKYGAKKGIESISDYPITFHYVNVEQLYNMEFYIYHLRPFGIVSGLQDLNVPRGPSDQSKLSADGSNIVAKSGSPLPVIAAPFTANIPAVPTTKRDEGDVAAGTQSVGGVRRVSPATGNTRRKRRRRTTTVAPVVRQ